VQEFSAWCLSIASAPGVLGEGFAGKGKSVAVEERILSFKGQCSMDISICIEGRHMHSTSHIATYTESTIGTYPSYFHSPGVSAAVDTTNSRPGKFSPC
jgi:hypothetical protein